MLPTQFSRIRTRDHHFIVVFFCRRPGREEPDGGDDPRHRRPRADAARRLQLHWRDRHHRGQRSGEAGSQGFMSSATRSIDQNIAEFPQRYCPKWSPTK